MARTVITALRPNETFQSPDGPVQATPERMRRMVETFQKMKAARLNIPVPFGHQLKALPESYDEEQFLKSRYNAGYLHDVRINKAGELEVVPETPALQHDAESGCLIDPERKTAIKEVSLALAKEFTDGKGRVWNDAIVHAALVTHPVVDGQEAGFQRMSLNANPRIGGLTFLSLGSPSQWRLALGDDDDDSDAPADPPAETPPPEETPAAIVEPFNPNLMQLLAEHGIVLPEDTDKANFEERLVTALTALKGRLEPMNSDTPPSVPSGATEGTSTQMLSLLSTSPAGQKLVAQHRLTQQREARAKLDDLKARGLRLELFKELETQVAAITTTKLSLTAAGDIATPDVFRTLDMLDKALPVANKLTQRLAMAKEIPSPIAGDNRGDSPEVKEQTNKLKQFAGASDSPNGKKK